MIVPPYIRQMIFLCQGILASAEEQVDHRLTLHTSTDSNEELVEEGREWRWTIKLFFEGGFYIRARMSELYIEGQCPETSYDVLGQIEYWWAKGPHQYYQLGTRKKVVPAPRP
jgi:hypothetical protein